MRTVLAAILILLLTGSSQASPADCYNATLPTQAEVAQAMAEAGVTRTPAIYTACDLQEKKGVAWYYDANNPVALHQGYPGSIVLDDTWREHDGLRQAFRQMAGQTQSGVAGSSQAASLMPAVEQRLGAIGYDVRGYSRLPAPSVRVAAIPRDQLARIDGNLITLSNAAPSGCDDVLIAHELAHDALYRMRGVQPASPQSEDAATRIAWTFAESPYRPNCVRGNPEAMMGGTAGSYPASPSPIPQMFSDH